MKSTYLHNKFTRLIPKGTIRTIVECGSRDCLDALALVTFYKPKVLFSFECNPESIPVCVKNAKTSGRILFYPYAVSDITGEVKFYATDMEKSVDKNIGASSLLQHLEMNQNGYVQKEIKVWSVRLDEFMDVYKVKTIDLLCFDLQGAEYLAIEGLGERIQDVRYLITEISTKHYYKDDMLYADLTRLLSEKGFQLLVRVGDDALYKNNNV